MDQQFREDVIERLTRIESLAKTTNGSVRDHESRVRRLERVAWGLAGAWTVVSSWFIHHIMGGK